MNDKKSPVTPTPASPTPAAPQTTTDKPKKKLSLDITDVSEVLERKISP